MQLRVEIVEYAHGCVATSSGVNGLVIGYGATAMDAYKDFRLALLQHLKLFGPLAKPQEGAYYSWGDPERLRSTTKELVVDDGP